MSGPDALRLEGVSYSYGDLPAIRRVDLRVGAGEIVCLLGPSGSGKTTVLRIAAGLEELAEGRVEIAGHEAARPGLSLPPERRNVGLVFQDYALFPHLTVAENVAFGLDRLAPDERRATALAMLERVGLTGLAGRYPHLISGGEQQRVALARALAPRPGLLLLDEPFSGLDIRLRDRVRDETLRVLDEAGIATLIVTHDPHEAMYLGDRIAVMREGRIVQAGPPAEVYDAPVDAFTADFLSEVNWLAGTAGDGSVATPFGPIDWGGDSGGTGCGCGPVHVLVRPEGLLLGAEGAPGAAATVVSARFLGHSSALVLRLDDDGREVRARVPAAGAPHPGTRVAVTLDRAQTFVFRAGNGAGVARAGDLPGPGHG
jgi:iron(III) transport system ATP-binding protein